jgi:hypothetical protein
MAWTGITLLIGALTFVAIYAATGIAANANFSNRGIPPAGISESVSTQAATPVGEQIAALPQVTATLAPSVAAPATNTQPAGGGAGSAAATPAPTQAQAAAGPAPTIPPIQDVDFDLGIAVQKNPDPNVYKVWVEMAGKQLKLNWVKSQVVWRDTEKVKGQIDWVELDVSMKLLQEGGMKVLLSITKAPDWARDQGAQLKPGVLDGPPANPQDLADFLTAILKRYPGAVHAVEVWNEINLDREWATNPQRLDPARYVTLLKTARDAIKAVDPNIIVVTAALSPTGANIGGKVMDDFLYFDQLVKAGMLQHADCVGAHHNGINVPPDQDFNRVQNRPKARFRGPWENPHHSWAFKTTLEGYATRIKNAGSNLKLCVTEFGWPSAEGLKGRPRQGFEFALDNSLVDQADFVDKAITLMQQWGFVRLAFLWNLNYGAQVGWSLEGAVGDNVLYSILGPDFIPRPVWKKVEDRNFRAQQRKATP